MASNKNKAARPTEEETSALWEILSTPSSLRARSSASEEDDDKTSPLQKCVASLGPILSHSFPRIKPGPPFERTLELSSDDSGVSTTETTQLGQGRGDSLVSTTSSRAEARTEDKGANGSKSPGKEMPLHLLSLPDAVLFAIFSFIPWHQRQPTLHIVSKSVSSVLTSPDFLLQRKSAHGDNRNELLFVVGGQCPVRSRSSRMRHISGDSTEQHRHRRMVLEENCGLWGYCPLLRSWRMFGGDPDTTPNHPLRNVVDAKALYLPHPYYSLLLFGGYDLSSGRILKRVVSYSFLSGMWEYNRWPDMLKPRRGEDFHVATVGSNRVVLIGCALEQCDCFRCDPRRESLVPMDCDGKDEKVDTVALQASGLDGGKSAGNIASDGSGGGGECEVLFLSLRTWTRRSSCPPSCPPDDGGIAVLDNRVYIPGTCPPPPPPLCPDQCKHKKRESASAMVSDDTASFSGSDDESSVDTMDHRVQSSLGKMDPNDCISCMNSNEKVPSMGHSASQHRGVLLQQHYRPGLVYDVEKDKWSNLPPRPFVTTSSPTTLIYRDRVLVMGGYRSSSENALSCYYHREEYSILDYEDHLDYIWWYDPLCRHPSSESFGEWTFGGGTMMAGLQSSWASAGGVAAAAAAIVDSQPGTGCSGGDPNAFLFTAPSNIPVPVRGAAATMYRGRLTMLGGLSTFSQTFYNRERKVIWQYCEDIGAWKEATISGSSPGETARIELPVPALLNGYAFSVHL